MRNTRRFGMAGRQVMLLALVLLVSGVTARVIAARAAGAGPVAYLPVTLRAEAPPGPPDELVLLPYATGFSVSTVTDIANAGDGRLFVVEKDGDIMIAMPDGSVPSTPFLSITALTKTGNWEEGVLGMAFHPNYAENGYFYVAYTGYPDFRVKLSRFTVSADPNVADPSSRIDMLSIGKSSEVHNGGDLAFGPDGYLYWPIGDGGPDPVPQGDPNPFPGDPYNHGQRTDELLAGILRLDVDKASGVPPQCESSPHYTVPADNPYVGQAGCDEIWATGLRNPWRISFDRETGDLWISDVGEWEYEEVNMEPAGSPGGVNYGWHCYEGTLDYSTKWPSVAQDCDEATIYTPPLNEYAHDEGCSITGGFVYRGQLYPELQGSYLYADFCASTIWRLSPTADGWERVAVFNSLVPRYLFTTFGEDMNGELYVASHLNGTIYRIAVP